jgi:hypothetical protein
MNDVFADFIGAQHRAARPSQTGWTGLRGARSLSE